MGCKIFKTSDSRSNISSDTKRLTKKVAIGLMSKWAYVEIFIKYILADYINKINH